MATRAICAVRLKDKAVFGNQTHTKGTVLEMDRSLADAYEKSGKGVIVPMGTPSQPERDTDPESVFKQEVATREPETTRMDRQPEVAVTRQGNRR